MKITARIISTLPVQNEAYLKNTRDKINQKVPECSLCSEGKQSILKPRDLQTCTAFVQFEHPIPAYRMHKHAKDVFLHSKTVMSFE
jgi:hypothetical protein